MNTHTQQSKALFFISILVHLGLLSLFCLSLNIYTPIVQIGDDKTEIVNSFIYKDVKNAPAPSNTITESEPKLALQKSTAKKIQQPYKQKQSVQASSSSRGVQTNELISLLHAAIQRAQQYPESAMELERQGRVTVAFTLFTNGSIQGLKLLKSSGTESLDNAAIAAVRDATPFKNVDQYLQAPESYTIDVVFQLA